MSEDHFGTTRIVTEEVVVQIEPDRVVLVLDTPA
jgi:hypothetical protein